jgi:transposase-like protein
MTAQIYCPDCGTKIKHTGGFDTDWYGRLDYYKCKCCKETFVSQNNKELAITANH